MTTLDKLEDRRSDLEIALNDAYCYGPPSIARNLEIRLAEINAKITAEIERLG